VFAIYANALVWFFQNGLFAGTASWIPLLGLAALAVVTVLGFGSLMFALSWGEKFTALLGPRFWTQRRELLRQPAFEALVAEGTAAPSEEQIESRVAILLRDDLLEDLTRCTERNMNLNERRFGYLHRAGQFSAAGFVVLVILVGIHLAAVSKGSPESPIAKVQVIGPVVVTPASWSVGGSRARDPESVPAKGTSPSESCAREAAAPATPGNKGGLGTGQDAAKAAP
jgi:hypothetical protein